MPFQSQAQRAYMYKFHPSIAKRWTAEYGGGGKLPYHKGSSGGVGKAMMNMTPRGTPSNESFNPSVTRVPRIPGNKRDYGMLHPSASARHTPKNKAYPNEQESTKDGPVNYLHGSRAGTGGRHLGHPRLHSGPRGQSMLKAHAETKKAHPQRHNKGG